MLWQDFKPKNKTLDPRSDAYGDDGEGGWTPAQAHTGTTVKGEIWDDGDKLHKREVVFKIIRLAIFRSNSPRQESSRNSPYFDLTTVWPLFDHCLTMFDDRLTALTIASQLTTNRFAIDSRGTYHAAVPGSKDGAGRGGRTPTGVTPEDFESSASAIPPSRQYTDPDILTELLINRNAFRG